MGNPMTMSRPLTQP